MIPLRVTAENYGPYGTVDWQIPEGLTAIVGVNRLGDGADSNGSGKTKLLELVPVALFGPPLPWSEYLTKGSDDTQCRVELTFAHGDDTYRVRRTFDAKGRGKTTLDLERWDSDADWHPLTRGDQKETQALINDLTGLSEATFAHSVFAAQGARHFADPTLPPRDRKKILTDALALDVWDRLHALCRADMGEVQGELSVLTARIGDYDADVSRADEAQTEHDALVASAEQAAREAVIREGVAEGARERVQELRTAEASHAALAARRDAAAGVHAALTAAADEAVDAATQAVGVLNQIRELEPLAAEAQELRDQINAITVADATREAAERERRTHLASARTLEAQAGDVEERVSQYLTRINEIRRAIDHKRADPGTCDACGQPLAGAALEKAIATMRVNIDTLETAATSDQDAAKILRQRAAAAQADADAITVAEPDGSVQRDDLHRRATLAQQAAERLAALRERAATLAHTVNAAATPEFQAKLAAAEAELAEADGALAAAPAFDQEALALGARELERASSDVAAARAEDRRLQAELAASGERLKSLASLAERRQEALLARTGLEGRLATLTALARSYGRDGIPALILEARAIPQIEAEAQRVLEALGMPFRVELVTQRETKAQTLKDTLDVAVHEPNGPRLYGSYSGGERTRVELALRIALARLIAQRSASACGAFMLDEPTWLDATGMAQLAEVLRGLTEFRSVLLVSHDERLVDAFDQRVTVVRDETGSRVEEAA